MAVGQKEASAKQNATKIFYIQDFFPSAQNFNRSLFLCTTFVLYHFEMGTYVVSGVYDGRVSLASILLNIEVATNDTPSFPILPLPSSVGPVLPLLLPIFFLRDYLYMGTLHTHTHIHINTYPHVYPHEYDVYSYIIYVFEFNSWICFTRL